MKTSIEDRKVIANNPKARHDADGDIKKHDRWCRHKLCKGFEFRPLAV